MTKSLGQFTGGQFLYWEHDDGTLDLDQANVQAPRAFDSKREMVLFDAARCHGITPFQGEKYSLTYFTPLGFEKLSTVDRKTLVGIGSLWPTELSIAYWGNLLGPPTGQCQNIRVLFGYQAKPSAVQPSGQGTPLSDLGSEVIATIFSFIIEPQIMPMLCGCSTTCNQAAWTVDAWAHALVDTSGLHPQGTRASYHWKLWRKACVIHGKWADKNVGVLLSSVRRWRFAHNCDYIGLKLSISSLLRKPSVTFHYADLRCVAVAFATSSKVEHLFDDYLSAQPAVSTGFLHIGNSNEKCRSECCGGVTKLELIDGRIAMAGDLENARSVDYNSAAQTTFTYFVVIGEHSFRPCWEFEA